MSIFEISSILVSISAALMFINFKFVRMPMTIGVMMLSLIFSMLMILFGSTSPVLTLSGIIEGIDFNETLMHGMLSFLLFAGALHVDISDLLEQKTIILILATLGVVFSTFLIGTISYYLFNNLFSISIGYIYCLLFGALISPTDPIAVIGILKETNSPKSLETTIAGESLFNDGVGVVVFSVILSIILSTGTQIHVSDVFILFAEEAIGGIIYGLILGYVFYRLLKSVDSYPLEIMLTLALVMGGYSLSYNLPYHIHVSGPLAMVISGLFIGNHGKMFAMSETTHNQLFSFWELIDEFLNALLFVLIGFQLLNITFNLNFIYSSILLVPIILFIRFLGVKITLMLLGSRNNLIKGSSYVMTWCGLRGGISVALALSLDSSLKNNPEIYHLILSVTFIVVSFSILVQGLTSKKAVDSLLETD